MMFTKYILRLIILTIASLGFCGYGHTASRPELLAQCETAMTRHNFQEMETVATLLLELSKRDGDKTSEGLANFYIGTSALFNGKSEISSQALHRAKDIAFRLNNDSLMAMTYNCLGIYEIMVENNPYLARSYLLQAISHGSRPSGYKRAVGGAYNNLAELAIMQHDTTALEYAHKSFEFGRANNKPDNMMCGAAAMAQIHHIKGDNDSARKYADIVFKISKQFDIAPMPDIFITLSSIEADNNHLSNAFRHAITAISEAEQENGLYISPAYLQLAKVQLKADDLKGSLNSLKKALDSVSQSGMMRYSVEILTLMGNIYEQMGLMNEAAKCYRQANDSISKVAELDKRQMLADREFIMETERQAHELQQHENEARDRERIVIFLVITIMLLSVLFCVTLLANRRKGKLYRSIVEQNKEAIKRERELKNRILHLEEQAALSASHQEKKLAQEKERAENLYARVIKIMDNERLYADPQLSRDSLAERLGTNRTYLSHAINELSGMNFAQFINSYRIKEAVKVLSDEKSGDISLSELALSLGFNNRATFNKLFQSHVGMSPATYRKSAGTKHH